MLRYIIIAVVIIAIIPVVGVGWYLLEPLFVDDEVNEPFPAAAPAPAATASAPMAIPTAVLAAAATPTATLRPTPTLTPTPTPGPGLTLTPSGPTPEFPLATRAVVPESVTMAQVETLMAQAASFDRPTVADAMPAMPAGADGAASGEPVALLSGMFQDADSFHRGSGTATVYQLGDGGRRVLRLDDFRVTNGPDLRVLLANFANPTERQHLELAGYVELAPLKGNVGAQNYDLPADFDLALAGSVVIYCDPFRVIFSIAPLTAAGTGG